MNRIVPVGLAIIAVLLVFGGRLLAQQAREPYLPLARVEIITTEPELNELVSELTAFAGQKDLTVRRGDFPKQGRWVLNLGLYFQTDSFFIIDNFIQSDRLTLVAYSHEAERTWRMTWHDLIARITSKVGSDRVLVVTP